MIAPEAQRLRKFRKHIRLPGICLRQETAGSAAIEFALVAPVFLTLLLGTFDIGQMVYAKSVLNGAVQSAARSSSLETGDPTAADKMVERLVKPVLPGVAITSKRVSYYDFADIGRPENWNDANGNVTCDNNEAYTDENGNGQWDEDIGVDGNGNANDVVIYQVTATYKSTFSVPLLPSTWNERSLTSVAVRKNQPFADQNGYGSNAGTCNTGGA